VVAVMGVVSESAQVTQRESLLGLYRASEYLVTATVLENVSFFSLLWWLVSTYLRFLMGEHDLIDWSRGLPLLVLSPQMQLIMLCLAASLLLWLYAVFGEMIPALRELETREAGLSTPLTMVIVGFTVALTLTAIQMSVLSIIYLIIADLTTYLITYLLGIGILVAYLLAYIGFFLIFERLSRLLGDKRFVTVGVLVLVSAFIFFLGPVAWFISFRALRDLLRTTV
jgi:hypothetical protein